MQYLPTCRRHFFALCLFLTVNPSPYRQACAPRIAQEVGTQDHSRSVALSIVIHLIIGTRWAIGADN